MADELVILNGEDRGKLMELFKHYFACDGLVDEVHAIWSMMQMLLTQEEQEEVYAECIAKLKGRVVLDEE